MLADNCYWLGWGDVVAWVPVLFVGNAVEVLLDKLFSPRQSIAPAHRKIMADQSGNPVVGGMGIFRRRARSIEFGAQIYGVLKPMNTDAKVEKYEALRLGYLPIVALTIRHTIPPGCQMSQSLTLELLRGEKTVSLKFTGLRQLRLANLGPGSSCLMNISSVAQEGEEPKFDRL